MPSRKSSTGVLLPRLTRVILCAILKSRSGYYDLVCENSSGESVISLSHVSATDLFSWASTLLTVSPSEST